MVLSVIHGMVSPLYTHTGTLYAVTVPGEVCALVFNKKTKSMTTAMYKPFFIRAKIGIIMNCDKTLTKVIRKINVSASVDNL